MALLPGSVKNLNCLPVSTFSEVANSDADIYALFILKGSGVDLLPQLSREKTNYNKTIIDY